MGDRTEIVVPADGACIHWRFWIEAGPDSKVTEVPQWGDSIMVKDVADNATFARMVLPILGTTLLETFLIANGAARANANGTGLDGEHVYVAIRRNPGP